MSKFSSANLTAVTARSPATRTPSARCHSADRPAGSASSPATSTGPPAAPQPAAAGRVPNGRMSRQRGTSPHRRTRWVRAGTSRDGVRHTSDTRKARVHGGPGPSSLSGRPDLNRRPLDPQTLVSSVETWHIAVDLLMRCAVVYGNIHESRGSLASPIGVTFHRGLVRSRTLLPCPDLPVCRRPAHRGSGPAPG